jgi:hypothetical protein
VIIGIDGTLSHGDRPHPVELRILGPHGRSDIPVAQDDIVDNTHTRFNLPASLLVRGHGPGSESGSPIGRTRRSASTSSRQPQPTSSTTCLAAC